MCAASIVAESLLGLVGCGAYGCLMRSSMVNSLTSILTHFIAQIEQPSDMHTQAPVFKQSPLDLLLNNSVQESN